MSAARLFSIASLLLLAGVSAARAQQDCECSPFYGCDNDLQWFDPVEFDLDCSIEEQCGFFFGYERTYWNQTGFNTVIGDPTVRTETYNPYPALGLQGDGVNTPFSNSPLPPPYGAVGPVVLVNSVQAGPPRANFALGHRYELGYNQENRGWLIGILDGGDHHNSLTVGTNGGAQSHATDPTLASPFGDVVVNFVTPVGYMLGFADIVQATVEEGSGRILVEDFNGDGILDGDGFADDIDGDGNYGGDGIDAAAPGFQPEPVVGPFQPDYDDLVVLPTSFRTLTAINQTSTKGIELMRRYQFDNRSMMKKKQHNTFEMFYGARFLQLNDEFLVDADGGVLGLSRWDTEIENNIIGPQVGYAWNHRRGKWLLNSQGRMLFGYNIQNWSQDGFIGEDLVPGAVNHPLYAHPHSFVYDRQRDDFAPVAELRIETSYLVTSNIALKVGWSGTYIGGIRRAADSVRYELPNMGFVDGRIDELFMNGVNFGLEISQ